jgi:TonB family protein
MKRVFVAALCFAALFTFSHAQAQAMLEFCPATLHVQAVGADRNDDAAPAEVYGFDLSALVPRSVSATLAFDTSAGWYTADVPTVSLAEKDRHYTLRGVRFVHRDFVSPVMYLRFPQAVKLNHSWVYRSGDATCPPPAAVGKGQNAHGKSALKMDPADEDRLSNAPPADAPILSVKSSTPLEIAACDEPFRFATATNPVAPRFPDMARMMGAYGTSVVNVAIDAEGSVADAWIFASSGNNYLDKAAMDAAKATTYEAGRSYCRPVPGSYRFIINFDPNQ